MKGKDIVSEEFSEESNGSSPTADTNKAKAPAKKRRVSRTFFVGLVGFAIGVAVGLAIVPASSALKDLLSPSPFEAVVKKCDLSRHPGAGVVGDNGATLSIKTVGEQSEGISMHQLACVFDSLDVSDAVTHRIEGTRALDGRQDASWDSFTASWTYHPDDGLEIVIERQH